MSKITFSFVVHTLQVPCRDGKTAEEALKLFYHEVPVLQLFSTPHEIKSDIRFTVDNDVQLVCKYLHAYKMVGNRNKGIDRLYREGKSKVQFSQQPNLSDEKCHELLQEFMPKHIKTKTTQKLFIR